MHYTFLTSSCWNSWMLSISIILKRISLKYYNLLIIVFRKQNYPYNGNNNLRKKTNPNIQWRKENVNYDVCIISPSWLQINKWCKRILENETVNDNRQFPRLHNAAVSDIRKCLSVIFIWLYLPFYDHDNQTMWMLKFEKKNVHKNRHCLDSTLKLSERKNVFV